MANKNKTKQHGRAFIWFFILILAFFAGFAYTQLQTSSVGSYAFIKKNTSSVSIPTIPTLTIRVKKRLERGIMTMSPTPKPMIKNGTRDSGSWGIAQKIGEHTYTIKLGSDERMGTAKEIMDALNTYRQTQGKGMLQWDDKLTSYAQTRATYFKTAGTTDEHSGLNEYLDHEDGFIKLGYNRIGENSYYGGPLLGVHVIEWLFASSPEHNANQLDTEWTHAGMGVTDTSVNVIFGGGKM